MFHFRVELYPRLVSGSFHSPGFARFKSTVTEEKIKQCYHILNIPFNSSQDAVRKAFKELAKKYHPDSGHTEASIERFCEIDDAFRVLTKKNNGSTEEIDAMEFDIKHTSPQHRQYLSYNGMGHGSPAEREKQYIQAKAQRALQNVCEHRIAKSIAAESILIKGDLTKTDFKAQIGFDRLVEDMIQEAMAKGEFDNLSGKGKPLKGLSYNPFVDFTTQKINEVLISNGVTPEWIALRKEIRKEIVCIKEHLAKERAVLGPLPLSENDCIKWKIVCRNMEKQAKKLNSKILSYNLIVPLADRQKFFLNIDGMAEEILKNGKFEQKSEIKEKSEDHKDSNGELLKDLFYIMTLVSAYLKKLLSRS